MAKKDTYLALLRRGIDESTAEILADAGLKIGEIKKLSQDQLEQNYGLKPEIVDLEKGFNTDELLKHDQYSSENTLANLLNRDS